MFGLPGVCGPRTIQVIQRPGHLVYLCGEHHLQPDRPRLGDIVIAPNPFPHICDTLTAAPPMVVYVELSAFDIVGAQEVVLNAFPSCSQAELESHLLQQATFRRSPLQQMAWRIAAGLPPHIRVVLCNNRHLQPLQLLTNPKRLLRQWLSICAISDLSLAKAKYDKEYETFVRAWCEAIDTPHKLRRLIRQVMLPNMGSLPEWWTDAVRHMHLQTDTLPQRIGNMKPALKKRCIGVVSRQIDDIIHENIAKRLNAYLQECIATQPVTDCFEPDVQEFYQMLELLLQDATMMVEYVEHQAMAAHHLFMAGDAHLHALTPFFSPAGAMCEGWQSDAYIIDFTVPPGTCIHQRAAEMVEMVHASLHVFLTTKNHGGGGTAKKKRPQRIDVFGLSFMP